jgi:hypothetical protein
MPTDGQRVTMSVPDGMGRLILFAVSLVLVSASCEDDAIEGPTDRPGDPRSAVPLLQVAIQTNGKSIVDEPKIMATMRMSVQDTVLYDGTIGIEYRGCSSQMFDKKSYGFETWDESGADLPVALAGLPEEEDWVLYGPFSDKSLLRNVLIYALSNEIGRYASRTVFCELFLNGRYEGVYVLMEKVKRDADRVAISQLNADDVTGGYILKIDKTCGDGTGGEAGHTDAISFASAYDGAGNPDGERKIRFLYDYPDPEDLDATGRAYIRQYIHDFESALMGADFADPTAGYRRYVDVETFIDFFLLNELAHNPDAYRLSTFMHKDKGGRLAMGPIWDFDLAFGNVDYCSAWVTDDWAYRFNDRCPLDPWQVPFWWKRLLEDSGFVNALKARWHALRQGAFSFAFIDSLMLAHRTRLEETGAPARNFGRWPILGTYVWPNRFVGQTYDEEYEYLRQWISDRLTWLDAAIDGLEGSPAGSPPSVTPP